MFLSDYFFFPSSVWHNLPALFPPAPPRSPYFPDQPPVFARVCNSISGRLHFLGRALRKVLSSGALNKNKASRRKSNTLLSVLLSPHSDRVVLRQVRLFQIRKSNRRQPLGDPLPFRSCLPSFFLLCFSLFSHPSPLSPPRVPHPSSSVHLKSIRLRFVQRRFPFLVSSLY